MKKKVLTTILTLAMVQSLTIAASATEIVAPKYYRVGDCFAEGLVAVQDESYRWGFVDKTGKEVIACQYSYPFAEGPMFSDGLAAVDTGAWPNQKRSYIDKTGQVVLTLDIKNDRDYIGDFFEGFAMVRVTDSSRGLKYVYIDKTGQEVIPPSDYSYRDVRADKRSKIASIGEYVCVKNLTNGLAAYNAGGTIYWDEELELSVDGGLWGFLAVDNQGVDPENITRFEMLKSDGGESLIWSLTNAGRVIVDLGPTEMVLVATYNNAGQFIGVKLLDYQHTSTRIDPSAPNVKLFWLDANQSPLSPRATVWGGR